MSDSLILALPSKGRLKEKALEVFASAGIQVVLPQDARSYRGEVPSIPSLEVAFLSASEISRELANGGVHLGVTGEDLARENIAKVDEKIEFIAKLGFGGADVVVAAPEAWLDVRNMAELGEVAAQFRSLYGRRLKVATKYFSLTTEFFTKIHGIDQYRIVESLGATEGAPAAGSADIIVDITSTGSTLRANQLRILDDGVILKSEANLMASKMVALSSAQKLLFDELKAQVLASL